MNVPKNKSRQLFEPFSGAMETVVRFVGSLVVAISLLSISDANADPRFSGQDFE
jgi:hypothetical protein